MFPPRTARHRACRWVRPATVAALMVFCCTAGSTTRPAAVATAQPFETPPRFYMGREIAQTMHYSGAAWLMRESRQREEDCNRLLSALRLTQGQTVCDLGCGNGFYALKMARLVGPTGHVFAVDIQPEMLRMLQQRAETERIRNVTAVLGTPVDPRLPRNALDLVLLVDVYHELSHPEEMLQAIRHSLKPDGRMVLVEFRAEDPGVPIKPLHKMSKQQIFKEIPANGFACREQFDRLPWQHLLSFVGRDLP